MQLTRKDVPELLRGRLLFFGHVCLPARSTMRPLLAVFPVGWDSMSEHLLARALQTECCMLCGFGIGGPTDSDTVPFSIALLLSRWPWPFVLGSLMSQQVGGPFPVASLWVLGGFACI